LIIKLSNLIPGYFAADAVRQSGIWLKDHTIKQGELIEVVAPSGRGKTSLIHFLYGMRSDYTGTISFNDNETRLFDAEQLAAYRRGQVSIVFQDLRLFNNQTVIENIEIKRQLADFHTRGTVEEMASRLGIAERLNAVCGTCSYGEQQRIAIIRALMQPFDLLLLDEPFSHLDRANALKAMALILEEVAKRNATVIFADLEQTEFFPNTKLLYL
jgi:ABC-type lipoprotein export system ATPase subunit